MVTSEISHSGGPLDRIGQSGPPSGQHVKDLIVPGTTTKSISPCVAAQLKAVTKRSVLIFSLSVYIYLSEVYGLSEFFTV